MPARGPCATGWQGFSAAHGPLGEGAPTRLFEGGLNTDAMVAEVRVAKKHNNFKLYRQAHIFARQGVVLDRSTLADRVGRAALLFEPVHGRLPDHLRASTMLFADENTAPVLDPGSDRTRTGQPWVYARDDRPWGGAKPQRPERESAELLGLGIRDPPDRLGCS